MIFDSDGSTTAVFQENIELPAFLKNLKDAYPKLKNENIILDLSSFKKLTAAGALEFLELSHAHRKSGKSFVLVTDTIAYDDVPDSMSLVPTLQEAYDLIEMEEIERDLEL